MKASEPVVEPPVVEPPVIEGPDEDTKEYYRYKIRQLQDVFKQYQTTPTHPQYAKALNSYNNAYDYWNYLLQGNYEMAEIRYNESLDPLFIKNSLGSWIWYTD